MRQSLLEQGRGLEWRAERHTWAASPPCDLKEPAATGMHGKLRYDSQLDGGRVGGCLCKRRTPFLCHPAPAVGFIALVYIDKIAHKFSIQLEGKVPATPMGLEELLKSETQAIKKSIEVYQQKVGSILFAAISTRPDIAFAVSRLARHNLNPSDVHHRAADRVIQYLYSTRSFALRLGNNDQENTEPIETFIGSSDASFADNTEDRKSSQGYVLRLYGGPIAWKASKQTTVTTSSTEAELVAASEAAKKMIAAGRLLNSLRIKLDEPLHLEIDNKQTIRLLVEESAKLATQLRHVDIYQHWLRQEVQNNRIEVCWVESKDMIADGMTKSLPKVRHIEFLRQLRIEDIRSRIGNEAKLEEARSKVRERLQNLDNKFDLDLKLGAKGGKRVPTPGGPAMNCADTEA